MSAGIKTDNFLTNWMIDRVSGSAQLNAETGKYEAGFFPGLVGGALGLNVDSITQTKETNINNTAANNLLAGSTYTRSDLGFGEKQKLTEAQVKSAVKAKNEAKKKAEKKENRDHEAGIRQEGYTRQDKQIAATQQIQNAQFAHTASEQAKDRALTRDTQLASNDLAMQMKLMDSELADKRMAYDRETRRMDKRDRALASLMAGIGQLGGAFAL